MPCGWTMARMEGSRQLASRSGHGRALRTHTEYRAALEAAVARSAIKRLPAAVLEQLLARGTRLDVPARAVAYRENDPPLCVLVVRGQLRIYATAPDGREFTLFWANPGEWLGQDLIAGGPIDISAQAVTAVTMHVFPMELLISLGTTNAAVTWEIARKTSSRLREAVGWIRMLVFGDLRGRVSQRLLELAFHQPIGAPLVAVVTQQDLADSVGSPRSSVARTLAELRREGLVRSTSHGILLVRPDRLAPDPRGLRSDEGSVA